MNLFTVEFWLLFYADKVRELSDHVLTPELHEFCRVLHRAFIYFYICLFYYVYVFSALKNTHQCHYHDWEIYRHCSYHVTKLSA